MVLQLAVSHLALPIHLVGFPIFKLENSNHLLLAHLLLNLRLFLVCEDVLRCPNVGQVTLALPRIVRQLELSFQLHLVKELVPHEILLCGDSLSLPVDKVLRLLWAEVWLIILPINFFLNSLALAVGLHLPGEIAEVFEVVLTPELLIMGGDHVGLVLLPAELLALVLTIFFYPFALILEAVVSQSVRLGHIRHELSALAVGVVVDLEWALTAHEVRVGRRVVTGADLFTVQCKADDGANIVLLRNGSVSFIVTVGLEKTVSGAVQSVHVLQ